MNINNRVGKFYSNLSYSKIIKEYYFENEILSYKSYFLKELVIIVNRIYKIALSHLLYQELNYNDLILMLKSELIHLEQLYIQKKYD